MALYGRKYSEATRRRVVELLRSGKKQFDVARLTGVNPSSVRRMGTLAGVWTVRKPWKAKAGPGGAALWRCECWRLNPIAETSCLACNRPSLAIL